MSKKTVWYKDMVFYQIWPRSFKDGDGDGMGDLYGVYEKLDYIKSLGCDGIWFSPLYPSPGVDCGYDISDYMDIAEEFGGMEAFEKVLDGRDYFLEDDGVYMGWKNEYHPKSGICNFFLTLFTENEDGSYSKHSEVQTEKLWTDDQIEQMLAESGLEKLAVYSGFDMKDAKECDDKRFYVVKCPENK